MVGMTCHRVYAKNRMIRKTKSRNHKGHEGFTKENRFPLRVPSCPSWLIAFACGYRLRRKFNKSCCWELLSEL